MYVINRGVSAKMACNYYILSAQIPVNSYFCTSMPYKSLHDCVIELEKNGQLIRIKEEVDPELEMAAIHLRIHEAGGKAILFEKIKGCNYQAISNIFGTLQRSKFIFRQHFTDIQRLVDVKNNPAKALKHPFKYVGLAKSAISSLPKKVNINVYSH